MPTLQSKLNDLAADLADAVLVAIRNSPLEELLGVTGGRARRFPAGLASGAKSAPAARPGRLKRRSLGEIAQTLNDIVALVNKSKDGLRAEEIRRELNLQAKELPRVLREGLARKVLKSKGQKRATTYMAT
jgi:hypothetical protein